MPDEIGDFIVCPYCEHIHVDKCDYPEDLINEERDMDCNNCGKTFEASCEVKYIFSTYEKKEEEDEN